MKPLLQIYHIYSGILKAVFISINASLLFPYLLYIQKFPRKYIFANSVKRHICHVKSSQFWPWLPISVNDKVFFAISRGFTFALYDIQT